jgi:zinc/manganese transport system ATP-binding protein
MVRLDNLTVSYRGHPALHHISGQLLAGSLTAVIGPNGSGKSTLLKSLAGLLPVAGGSLVKNCSREATAYLPQLAEIDRSFPINVRDCVMLGCWPELGAFGGVDNRRLARVDAALQAVGLQGFERRGLASLSSGQLQRMLFARLIVQEAELILLDEPFSAMDSRTTAALLVLIRQWHSEGRTVVAVLHDDAQVHQHFPQALLLARELVAWGPTAEVVTNAHLARARRMAETWDENAALCQTDESSRAAHMTRVTA